MTQPLQHTPDTPGELAAASTGARPSPAAHLERPTESRDQQLADLLEDCLRAERSVPGGAAALVQAAPEALRSDLERLLAVAEALRQRSMGQPTPAVVADLRARIMARIEPNTTG